MFLTNAGLDPVEREIPVDATDRSKGTFNVILQPIPVGKYRALCRILDDKRTQLEKVGTLLDKPLDLEGVSEALEIEERVQARERLTQLREKAEEALFVALIDLVSWGLIGYSNVCKADKVTQYEANPFSVRWAGFEYKNLDRPSLHLFGKLGMLWHLVFVIMSFQNGQLPETLEDFYKKDPQ